MQKRFSILSIIKLRKIVNEFHIDIVHTHGYRSNFYGRISNLFNSVIMIATVHVSLYDYVDTPAILKNLYLFLEKILSFKTSRFVCISKAMQSDSLRLGIRKNKIALIPNGIDFTRFKQNPSEQLKQELGLNGFGPIIGTVGRMVTEKGQQYLVEALSKLKTDWPDIKCLFIGCGPKFQFLNHIASNCKVEDACIFLGNRFDIEMIYPVMNLFVLPSFREPFGLSLLEAMACGVPVISTKNGGPLDFIESGQNGLLVQSRSSEALAEGIKFMLTQKNKAKSIAINGQKTVIKHYNVKAMVQKIEYEYLSMI